MARLIRTAISLLIGLLFVSHGYAQPAPRPVFEVASIKPSTNCETSRSPAGVSPGRLTLPCISLRALIRAAYSAFVGETMSSRLLEVMGGPAWLDSDRYDISAKSEGNASGPQMMGPMLQTLIEERFSVKVHREPRDSQVYVLTVAKNNPRLRPAKAGCTPMDLNNSSRPLPGDAPARYCGGGSGKSNGTALATDLYAVTMAEFAGRMITREVDRPVIDETGLTGPYDIHVEFVPHRSRPEGLTLVNGTASPDAASPQEDGAGPSIFVALQEQLGLKLSPAKRPLDVIVVDHAERPTAN
jgi:uncharacterized protein (TIGR03435 family)